MASNSRGWALERAAMGVLGVYLGASGVLAMARGDGSYRDLIGLAIPWPLAIAVGGLLLFGALRRSPPA